MKAFLKRNWAWITFGTPLLLGLVSWVIHVESSLDWNRRVDNLEELIEPLVRQHIFEEECVKQGLPIPVPPHEHPEYVHDHVQPAPQPPVAMRAPDDNVKRAWDEAESQARDMVQRPLRH